MTRILWWTSMLTLAMTLGCGGSGSGKQDNDATADAAADGGSDAVADVALDCTGIDTVAPADAILAGELALFACTPVGCPAADAGEASLQVAGDPATFDVDGLDVRFYRAGTYEVACAWGEFVDDAPVTVEVQPGLPATVTTTLDVTEVKAGTQVKVGCAAVDGWDNPIYGPFELLVSPDDGGTVQGTLFTPTVVGKYDITCVAAALYEGNPVKLSVIPDVPRKLHTYLAEETVVAGKSVKITCEATDKWGNKVAGFPMGVYLPGELDLQGLTISSTVAGFYEVKCVPQAEKWELFTLFPAILTVLPAPPALMKLKLVPDKSVYKVLDKVLLQVVVRDMYGNLIPDAPLQPVQVSGGDGLPTDGIVETQPFNYKLVSEGTYKLGVVSQQDPAVKAQAVLQVDGSGPLLAIDYPDRGATIGDKPAVTVTGTVSDTVTGLESFTLNGEEVDVSPDNSFSHIVVAGHAVNHLVAEALDAGGESTRTTRAFAFASRWYKPNGSHEETFVPGGLQIFLNETFVDDGNHDPAQPDDLATLFEVILGNIDFGALIPNPIYNANNYKVFIQNVTLDAPAVTMDLVEGGLSLDAAFKSFSADVDAVGSCSVLGVDLCPDVGGTLTIDSISLYAVLKISLEDGKPTAKMGEFHLGISGIKLNLSGLGSLLDPILNGIIGLFEQQVEDALAGQLQNLLPELIADLFAQFQLDQNIDIPALVEGGSETTVNLTTTYSKLDFSPSGIVMVFDSRASASKQVVHSPLGAIGRGTCAGPEADPYVIPQQGEVAVALYDDMLNQLLFAMWWGGALNLTLDEAVLGDFGGELAGYGISEPTITLDFFLAPMLSDCNPEETLRLGIGDLYIQAQFKMLGQPLSMGIFATATGDATLALVEGEGGPEFQITVTEIGLFDYEIVSITPGFENLIPMVQELLGDEVLKEALAQVAGQSFGGIALPQIDLGGLVPGIPPGTSIAIVPEALERVFGHTELTATLK